MSVLNDFVVQTKTSSQFFSPKTYIDSNDVLSS